LTAVRSPRRTPSRARSALLGLAAIGLLATASGGERPTLGAEEITPTTTEPTTTTTAAPVGARVATAKGTSIKVYDSPTATAPTTGIESIPDGVLTAEEATDAPGIPIVFLVKGESSGSRHQVYLPVRPNGSTAWVDDADVKVIQIPYAIRIDLSGHRLQVLKDDQPILDAPIGVGTTDTPSPGGIYYLKELLQPPNPNGAYGPYAYGLSGFSNVLTSFNGGDGVIGIHGTNDPSTIGTNVSHGCIRLNNDQINKMVHDIGLPLGTPVEIQA
jgi:lipoprotein-anchoring transpeptidase ErfK/SrfK